MPRLAAVLLCSLVPAAGASLAGDEAADPSPFDGGLVTGFLVEPAGKGPFAGIVFGHWGPGNRTEFLPEAAMYAEAGAVSVLIDYPWVRPDPWRRNQGQGLKEADKDRDSWRHAVVDLRRAFDLLEARPDVDRARLAYVGHSYGAQWGAILTAVDRRMKAPLLFQFARHERSFTEADMNRYYAAASQPKEVRWYSTGHDLNDLRALADRAAWLGPRIGLQPLRPVFEQRLQSLGR